MRDQTGSANPNWRGGPLTLSCEYCGASFQKLRAEAARRKHHYCSLSCAGKARCESDAESFWSKTRLMPTGCIEWRQRLDMYGYGKLRWNGRQECAHRVAYLLTFGEFQRTKQILHRCDNPTCINPAHLFIGDHTVNMRDAAAKGRLRPGGHTMLMTRESLGAKQTA